MRIVASAPGKLVILGEYAVLEGAPALVQAVNQRARVTLASTAGEAWEIVSPTLNLSARLQVRPQGTAWLGTAPPELDWVATLLAEYAHAAALPACHVELDSDAFYVDHAGTRAKLGLGSSAALTVALAGALHALAGKPAPTLRECIAAHRTIQHGNGSGIDIAASLSGGLLRFDLHADIASVATLALPTALHWFCVYSGRPTSTRTMLNAVAAWRTREPAAFGQWMHELATISSRGIDAVTASDATSFLSRTHAYASALARFGEAAGVDIASREHRTIGRLATEGGCVYKSCGAGGGDVGITFGVDNHRLQETSARIAHAGYPVIALQADPKGLEVESTV